MTALQRNQLVWLNDAAWQALRARPWDAQAQNLLAHWHAQQLPLVVCRQRLPHSTQALSLGLPAPLQWQRRKLALDVAADAIARVGSFPLLQHIPLDPADAAPVQALLQQTDALQLAVQVYGSFGWQQLSGLPCVRPASDLDLLVEVPDLATAAAVARKLQALHLGCRVDGELVFPAGLAMAWRELLQLLDGAVDRVLVKDRCQVQLLGLAQLQGLLELPVPGAMAPARQAPGAGALAALPTPVGHAADATHPAQAGQAACAA